MNIHTERSEDKVKAQAFLEKAKAYEKKIKLHRLELNSYTTVYCKNEDRLEDYKKLK